MTEEKLKAYRANRAELTQIEQELAEYEVTIAVQSAAEPPYSLHTATQSGLPTTPRVISLLERQSRLRASCAAVERFAENIDDDELRTIIKLRYLSDRRHSWQEIALRLGYKDEGTTRKRFRRFIQNMH